MSEPIDRDLAEVLDEEQRRELEVARAEVARLTDELARVRQALDQAHEHAALERHRSIALLQREARAAEARHERDGTMWEGTMGLLEVRGLEAAAEAIERGDHHPAADQIPLPLPDRQVSDAAFVPAIRWRGETPPARSSS